MSKTKIQVYSDLHLEITRTYELLFDIPVKADILVLAGDIGNCRRPNNDKGRDLKLFLEQVSKKFKKVFYVLGNHEFYFGEFYETKRCMKEICDLYDNVELLDNRSVVYEGIRFVGTTLWSDVIKDEECEKFITEKMSDYQKITYSKEKEKEEEEEDEGEIDQDSSSSTPKKDDKKLYPLITIDIVRKLWEKNVEFLKCEFEDAKSKGQQVVVISHNPPVSKGVSSRKKLGDMHDKCNSAWVNNLECLLKEPVVCWIYGHTHFNGRVEVNGIPVVCNQWGYKRKFKLAKEFEEGYVVEI